MANTIKLSKEYIPTLDEVYQEASLTSDLNGSDDEIIKGNKAGEYLVAKISMNGLGDYDRNSGYTDNNVTLEWETIKADYDRGTKITVDRMDNEEASEIPFAKANAELIRTKVAPEGDAYTFAKFAGTTGISKMTAKTLTTSKEVIAEITDALTKMDEDEVPAENRYLYITPTLYNLAYKEDMLHNAGIFDTFKKVVKVPQRRFYTAIKLLKGKDEEVAGHYTKAEGGKEINFMIVEKSAVIKHDKHIAHDIIPAELNAESDGDIMKYRKYGIVQIYGNKVAGIALSHKA